MSRSRESRPRESWKQQTKITFAARARTYHGEQGFALLAHSLLSNSMQATVFFLLVDFSKLTLTRKYSFPFKPSVNLSTMADVVV